MNHTGNLLHPFTILLLFLSTFLPFLLIAQSVDYSLPLKTLKVTSHFGYRIHPISGKRSHHSGVDFASRSDSVLNVLNGYVKSIGTHKLLGKYIQVAHGNVETIYGHLSQVLVLPSQAVYAGQAIAFTGKTGRVTGEHLHFSVKYKGRYLDPLIFLRRLNQY